MDLLNQWVGSILCFLIFITMITILLPSKKYERYFRFFAGMVLILLVTQPLTGSLRLEDRIAYYFEAISFQKESQDLNRQILGIEKERLERVIAEYEYAVEQDVAAMAEDLGFLAEKVDAAIESDQDAEDYGKVTHVFLRVVWDETDGDSKDGSGTGADLESGEQRDPVTEETIVEPVEITDIAIADIQAAEDQAGEGRQEGADEELRKLRRKVERYYGLESKKVELELKVR